METPSLRGKRILLRPPDDSSISYLYQWELELSSKYLWTENCSIPDGYHFRDDFVHQLKSHYHVFLMVYIIGQETPAGFIYSYNFNRTDGFLHTTIFIAQEHRAQLIGAEAGVLFHDYLFQYYPLRKVYSNVFSYNQTSLDFLLSAGFVVEGELKQHRYFCGAYHSMFTLALYRDEFYRKSESLLTMLKKQQDKADKGE